MASYPRMGQHGHPKYPERIMTRPLVLAIALLSGAPAGLAQAQPAAAQPPPAAPARPPADGPATFRIFHAGRPVGVEQVDVRVTGAGWEIATNSQPNPGADFGLKQAEFAYDSQGQPRSARLEAVAKDKPVMVTTTFADGKANSQIIQGDESTTRSIALSPGAIVLPNNVFGAYEALAARLFTATPGTTFRLFVMPTAEVGMTLDSVAVERVKTAGRAFESRHHKITIHNTGAELKADLWTDDRGRLTRFVLPISSIDVAREDMASVATRQQTSFRENDEDVAVAALGFNLAATVSKPKVPPPAVGGKPAKLPAIVLIGGSGPTDRDETVFGIPIFGQLASALADAGFIVLRYDKRGVGQSGGRTESATLADYAEDALAAVKYLREKRKDVDDARVALIGHSEGAAVALLAAKRESKKIRALVLIAGPGTTGAELILEQQQHVLQRSTLPEAEKQAKIALQKKIQAAVISGTGWEDIPLPLRQSADTPWFRSMLQFDPAPVMKDVKQPILIVQPELDRQVPAAHAEKLAALARARKNAPDVQVVLLPGLNHLLVQAKTGEVEEYQTLDAKAISADVSARAADWLKATLAPKS